MTDSENIRVIAGLGNCGKQYTDNRHNAGFWLIDKIAHHYNATFTSSNKYNGYICCVSIGSTSVYLFKPEGFINSSGSPIQAFTRYHKISMSQILVAYDEVDFDIGKVRLKYAGASGGHNGVKDIIQHLGNDFWRLRIGIGHPGSSSKMASYVLSDANEDERAQINWILNQTIDKLELILNGKYELAMNQLHGLETQK